MFLSQLLVAVLVMRAAAGGGGHVPVSLHATHPLALQEVVYDSIPCFRLSFRRLLPGGRGAGAVSPLRPRLAGDRKRLLTCTVITGTLLVLVRATLMRATFILMRATFFVLCVRRSMTT